MGSAWRTRSAKALAGALLVAAFGFVAAAPARSAPVAPTGGRWIVTLVDGVDPAAVATSMARHHGGDAAHVYTSAVRGFSFVGSAHEAAALGLEPFVESVIADRPMRLSAQSVPTGIDRVDAEPATAGPHPGVVADIAILDTGVDVDHPDLDVVAGKDCTGSGSYDDDHGHGTHVAGTAAARHNDIGVVGVAPGARIWSVKVLDALGEGSVSSVLCGIDWVTANAATIEVANLSIGGEAAVGSCQDDELHEAICRSVAAGVAYVVAAGNHGADASGVVPAAYDEVITVSALADFDGKPGSAAAPTCEWDGDDTVADFSNFGTVVDLIAPGTCIRSTFPGGTYRTSSGTSMAAPHVAGAAARYLATHPSAAPAEVRSALIAAGTSDWNGIDDPDGVHEPLLDVGRLGRGVSAPNARPTASFEPACTELMCTFDDTSTDADGVVSTWAWTFGDGATSSSPNPTHTYGLDGTYVVTLTVTDAAGASHSASRSVAVARSASRQAVAAWATAPPGASAFVPLAAPRRLFDTRTHGEGGFVTPGSVVTHGVAGRVGVPSSGVSAVVVNVTGTGSAGAGFVTVWPAGQPRPNTSTLNFTGPGQTRPNLAVVPLGADGALSFYSDAGTHLVVDIAGYFVPAASSTAGRLHPAAPARILDTRTGLGAAAAKPPGGTAISLQAGGRGGVPTAGASVVVLNVTATGATAPGYVTVWPSGQPRPTASNLNLQAASDTTPNLVIVPLGADGAVELFTESGAHLIADVVGWFSDATAPPSTSGLFVPLSPTRLFDTRPLSGLPPDGTATYEHAGQGDIPQHGVSMLSVNVTGVESTAPGYVTAWPAASLRPNVSTLNVGFHDTRPNAAILPLDGDGRVSYYSESGTHLLVDAMGYFTS